MHCKYFILLIAVFFLVNSNAQTVCLGPLKVDVDGSDTGLPLEVSFIQSNIYCNGSNDGAIEMITSGGTPNYQYQWSNGMTTHAIYNLPDGNYSVTVTDYTLCTKELTIDIRTMDPIEDELFIAQENLCGSCYLTDGNSSFIYQGADYMVHVLDVDDNLSLGNVEVCLNIQDDHIQLENEVLLNRSWSVKMSDGQAIMSLFFTTEEIESLMTKAGFQNKELQLTKENIAIKRYIGIDPTYEEFANVKEHEALIYLNYDASEDVQFVDVRLQDLGNFNYHHLYLSIPINTTTSVEEEEVEIEENCIKLLSNPVQDILEIVTEGINEPLTGRMSIYDIGGRKIQNIAFNNEILNGKKIAVTQLPTALYLLSIEIEGAKEPITLKFVKTNN